MSTLKSLFKNLRTVQKGQSEGFTGEKTLRIVTPWERLYEAMKNKEVLQGKVDGIKDGNLIIFLDGIKGIIKPDEIGEPRPKRLSVFVGAPVAFKVKACDRGSNEVYLSRKDAIETMSEYTWKELKRDCAKLLEIQEKLVKLQPKDKGKEVSLENRKTIRDLAVQARKAGPVRTGTVRSVVEDGAYLDIGGVSAYLPNYEISWDRVDDAREVLKPGESFEIKIIRVDFETGWMRGSVKSLLPNPWENVPDRYQKGGIYKGVVKRKARNGNLAVTLEPGVLAMCPPLTMQELEPGASVRVRISLVDPDKQYIRGMIAGENRWAG